MESTRAGYSSTSLNHMARPFVVARRHGQMLNRNYGWAREMFVLKTKS